MRRLAREEAERAGGAVQPGETAWIVVLASFEERLAGEAAEMRDRLQGEDFPVGIANSFVYPELRDGWVVVLAGPWADRTEAESMLPDLRARVARDAFLKGTTLQAP
jgi:cell division septation protein DedD